MRSMLRELIIQFGLPLVFANALPEYLGLPLGALPTLGLTGMSTFSDIVAAGPCSGLCPSSAFTQLSAKERASHGFTDVAPRPGGPAAWRAAGYASEPLIIDDAANNASLVAVKSSST